MFKNIFGKEMSDDINLYVMHDKLNNASFRQKLDPIEKNIFRKQNPLELTFKEISTFYVQSPIIGSLIKKLDLRKKDVGSTLIKKAPSTVEIEIQSRLNTLKNNPTFFSSYNSNLPPPSPSSPFQLPSFHLLQPPTFRASPTEFRQFQLTPPPVQNNFNFRKTKTTTKPFGELRAEKTLEDSKQGKLQ